MVQGGVFENFIKKLYFALAKTPDYAYLSQLHQNVTISDGLVGTVIVKLHRNTVQDATLAIDSCYKVRVPVFRNFSEDSEVVNEDEAPRGLLLSPAKRWREPISSGLYSPGDSTHR